MVKGTRVIMGRFQKLLVLARLLHGSVRPTHGHPRCQGPRRPAGPLMNLAP